MRSRPGGRAWHDASSTPPGDAAYAALVDRLEAALDQTGRSVREVLRN